MKFDKVNQAAFCTVTSLSVSTVVCAVQAATAASTAATVAWVAATLGLGAVSAASVTAWLDRDSTSVERYFANVKKHGAYAVAGMSQFVAQTVVQAVVRGISDGIEKAIRRKISGPDVTVKHA
jgi:SNF family Na+-dependent transporter